MTRGETLAEYYGLTYRVIHRQLNGLTNEESFLQPPFRGNCLNWVLGHVVFSREAVLSKLGESFPWTEAEAARYTRNSEPVTSAGDALPLERLLTALEESQERIVASLKRVSDEDLQRPAGDETVGSRTGTKRTMLVSLSHCANWQARTIK
ncbi:MAG TPA: DinB family protein [Ktedonobacteraceae bacterium]